MPIQLTHTIKHTLTALCVISASAQAATNCSLATTHCVGPNQEFNTSSTSHVESAFQSAINSAVPGDTIAIKGGNYQHLTTSPTKTFMSVNVSGTARSPITITPFDGESVTITGFGFPEGSTGPTTSGEALIHVYGDYITIKNLELSNSSRWGIVASGSFGHYENIEVHDSWESNIIILGKEKNIEGNIFRHIESYRSRHGSGIWLVPSASTPKIVKDTRIENSLLYRNGYQPDGNKVPDAPGDNPGGGNSDGLNALKNCQQAAATFNVVNLCPGTMFIGNITHNNADDGIDVSFGDKSSLVDNISFDNGPMGNKGFKIYTPVSGGVSFIGNVAMGNISTGIELRIQETGTLYNNTTLSNGLHGNRNAIQTGGTVTVTNNVGAYNTGTYDVDTESAGVVSTNNWDEGRNGSPNFTNGALSGADINVNHSLSIENKVKNIKEQFRTALSPTVNSPLIDAGAVITGVHCPTADDNNSAPMDPNANCRHWLGNAPDIGAFENGLTTSENNLFSPPTPPAQISAEINNN